MYTDMSFLLIYLLASFFIIVVPGPTVTVIVANSLRAGTAAGLLNVLGTQVGLFIMVLIVALSLKTVMASMLVMLVWVKIIGALYLFYLGCRLLLANGVFSADRDTRKQTAAGYFWQGFLVIWSNPKAFLFLGAFLPQFVDPARSAFMQTIFLGTVFMLVGAVFDSVYAVVAGRAGSLLSVGRVRMMEIVSGCFLLVGAAWLGLMNSI